MLINANRIEKYLNEIATESDVISSILTRPDQDILKSPDLIRSLKYSIIVISEAMVNTLHHMLAKKHNVAISGYKEAFVKAREYQIISSELSKQLQPFISFRNMLVHQYWKVDDNLFLQNTREGINDFRTFVNEINKYLSNSQKPLE